MIQIIPSLLDQTEEELAKHLREISKSVKMVQIDIADGKFVPNKTCAAPDFIKKNLTINCELHLMVKRPIKEIKKWTRVPQVSRVLFHFESNDNIKEVIKTIHNMNINNKKNTEAGIVLNPGTPIEAIDPYLNQIQAVMFMGVRPGFQGQKFIPETLERVKKFKSKGTNHFVSVDGAVNEDTLPGLIEAGVDGVCPGSAIVGNQRPLAENISRMREIIHKFAKK